MNDFAPVQVLLKLLPQRILERGPSATRTNTKLNIDELSEHLKTINNDIDFVKVTGLLQKLQREENVMKNDQVREIIFKSLELIFRNTNKDERLFNFDELVCSIYDSITQLLIKHKNSKPPMTYEEFEDLVRMYIPLAKLSVIKDISYKNKHPNTELVQELTEYLQMPHVLREDVYSILTKLLQHKNFKLISYNLADFKNKDGNLSDYLKLVTATEEKSKIRSDIFFVKLMPSKLLYFQEVLTPKGFKKEVLFYKTFIPIAEQLGMTDWDFLPKCYLAKKDLVVLNDLSVQGYASSQEKFFDYEHLLIVVKQLAKLHSLSFLIEHKLSKTFGETVNIDEYFSDLTEEHHILPNELNETHMNYAVYDLDAYSYLAKRISVEEFKKRAKAKLTEVYSLIERSSRYKNVLCHGDIWKPNIFFNWDVNNQPYHSVILDFQLLKYCPQAVDLLMVTYVNATKETRDKYGHLLLQHYHTELKSTLNKFDIDVEDISSFEDLKQSMDDLKVYGIFVGMLYNKFMGLPKDKIGNILKDPVKNKQFWCDLSYRIEVLDSMWVDVDQEWKRKCEGNVIDFYELCMLT